MKRFTMSPFFALVGHKRETEEARLSQKQRWITKMKRFLPDQVSTSFPTSWKSRNGKEVEWQYFFWRQEQNKIYTKKTFQRNIIVHLVSLETFPSAPQWNWKKEQASEWSWMEKMMNELFFLCLDAHKSSDEKLTSNTHTMKQVWGIWLCLVWWKKGKQKLIIRITNNSNNWSLKPKITRATTQEIKI